MELGSAVSVIIPSLNSPVIDDVLSALRPQADAMSHNSEIIVVGKDDLGLVKTDDVVRFVDTGTPVSPAVARNIGVKHSCGDIVCFLDADCIPHPHWLQNLLACYQDPNVTVAGGGVTFPSDGYWRLADNIGTFYPYLHTLSSGVYDLLPSLNLSLRRVVWEQIGPFDERYPKPAGEDADWTTRARLAGHQLHFQPEAVVIHCPARTTLKELWHHAVVFGQYSIKVDERYWELLGQSFVFKHWLLIVLTAPVVALWVTACVYSRRQLWRYLYALPAVYVSKLGWCWGASQRLRGRVEWNQPEEQYG